MAQISADDLKLVPLRLPTGWMVQQNAWFDFEPEEDEIRGGFLPSKWSWLEDDLLLLQHAHYQLFIDLGWYPAGSEDGQLTLKLYEGEDISGPPQRVFQSRSTRVIQTKIEDWLDEISQPGFLL